LHNGEEKENNNRYKQRTIGSGKIVHGKIRENKKDCVLLKQEIIIP